MNQILELQAALQRQYAELAHYDTMDPSESEEETVGEVYAYIREMQRFLNEEIEELLLELSNGDRAIHKPWSVRYNAIRDKKFLATGKTASESIDAFCFMMNIMLAAGVTPLSINEEYGEVWEKNTKRQADATY